MVRAGRASPRRRWTRTAIPVAGFAIALLCSMASEGSASAAATGSGSCHARISSVSTINASYLGGRIVISGSCLGRSPQFLYPHTYYGPGRSGKDTLHCGTTTSPAMRIVDDTGGRVWEGGVADNTSGPWPAPCSNINGLGLYYHSWNSTRIVINGFGDRLQSCAASGVALCKGDKLTIQVYNPSTYNGAVVKVRAT